MKQFGIAIMLLWVMALSGCGSSSNSSINGNWTATLTSANGTQALAFTVSLAESGSALNVTNLTFTTSSSCFALGTTATGAFTATGTSGGVTTGTFQLTIQSGTGNTNGANQLTLQGTLTNNTITGNWTLTGTGAGCSGSGTFTMSS
ncbi:MAG TPA: hypothetical protein VKR57_08145 [Terriglobales bacterium]|jgi:hypothetical protein|nr:hypothetical protein [Terriglobales bacterium]